MFRFLDFSKIRVFQKSQKLRFIIKCAFPGRIPSIRGRFVTTCAWICIHLVQSASCKKTAQQALWSEHDIGGGAADQRNAHGFFTKL